MVLIKKKKAGSDSHGNHWERDGAVVDVPHDEALTLLAIPDGGFAEVAPEPEPETPEPPKQDGPTGDGPAGQQQPAPVVEPAPAAPAPPVVQQPAPAVAPVVEPVSAAEVTQPVVEQPPAPVEPSKKPAAVKRQRTTPTDKG